LRRPQPSQTIGDYVLAHAYLRDDHVLDDVLPTEIPIPPIAEVQQALFDAALEVTGEDAQQLKERLRTGTVVTTDDRNWELRFTLSAMRFNQSRAVAVDMESATVAAQGYRFRVPYGTLLCVSDKPLHGEIKLPGQANAFYERAISQHLRIGIETLRILKTREPAPHAASSGASTSRRSGKNPSPCRGEEGPAAKRWEVRALLKSAYRPSPSRYAGPSLSPPGRGVFRASASGSRPGPGPAAPGSPPRRYRLRARRRPASLRPGRCPP
jgi:hypothetical protein